MKLTRCSSVWPCLSLRRGPARPSFIWTARRDFLLGRQPLAEETVTL